jgi:hypothetical protein
LASTIDEQSDPAPADDLAALDSVTARLVARAAPIRYAIAATEDERRDVFRLRYRAVIDRGWARPEDLPDGLERDADDDRAVLVGAWDGTSPVAAARLIFPSADAQLPVEALFGLIVEPRGRVVHVDRITVDHARGDRDSRLLLGLVSFCWLEIRKRGFRICAGIDSPSIMRYYRRLGLEMTILGPPRSYWGEERFPVRFDPAGDTSHVTKFIENHK